VILDASGKTFVANIAAGTVTEYPPGARGDVQPVVTITGIASPRALALDSSGHLFVATSSNTIVEYAAGASGAANPISTITGQSNPEGLAFDGNGDLYVTENSIAAINEYAPGASGAANPINTIGGDATGLASPQSLVVDSSGDLTVANAAGASVTIYGPGASGNVSPLATLTGGLQSPVGVDRGTDLAVFVGDPAQNAIVEFAPGTSFPMAVIGGPDTGLGGPLSVAATPPLSVLTTTLSSATRGRSYLANLRAGEGTTPYRWKLLHGHLPPGLHLTQYGALQGTPRHRRRTYHVTVEVSDASQPAQTATQKLTLTVQHGTT
jgi:hypothetical protein